MDLFTSLQLMVLKLPPFKDPKFLEHNHFEKWLILKKGDKVDNSDYKKHNLLIKMEFFSAWKLKKATPFWNLKYINFYIINIKF